MGHTFFLHSLLAVHAHFPILLYRLVTAYVDILVREKLNDFLENCLKKPERAVVSYAEIP